MLPSGAVTVRSSSASGLWLKKKRSLETAASTVIQSALDSTVVEGSSQTLCAPARPAAVASAQAMRGGAKNRFHGCVAVFEEREGIAIKA